MRRGVYGSMVCQLLDFLGYVKIQYIECVLMFFTSRAGKREITVLLITLDGLISEHSITQERHVVSKT